MRKLVIVVIVSLMIVGCSKVDEQSDAQQSQVKHRDSFTRLEVSPTDIQYGRDLTPEELETYDVFDDSNVKIDYKRYVYKYDESKANLAGNQQWTDRENINKAITDILNANQFTEVAELENSYYNPITKSYHKSIAYDDSVLYLFVEDDTGVYALVGDYMEYVRAFGEIEETDQVVENNIEEDETDQAMEEAVEEERGGEEDEED